MLQIIEIPLMVGKNIVKVWDGAKCWYTTVNIAINAGETPSVELQDGKSTLLHILRYARYTLPAGNI
jgi:hypothetical protein